MTTISVIIPTFRRSEGLATALLCLTHQTLTGFDVIVCDNSPEASARAQVTAFAASVDFDVIYLHEPATGVANARNRAVAACTADFIAFLDDDEEAPPDWLARLMAAQSDFNADVVFGPVTARLPKADTAHDGYIERFFSRFGPQESQLLSHYYGCGNSLIRCSALPKDHAPFSVAHNNMGGEDDQLFHGLMTSGAVIAWAHDAPVFEDVPDARARLSYTLLRAFAYGQGPSYTAAKTGKPVTCAAWMAQGLAQALLFGAWGGLLALTGQKGAARRLDKAARGGGKVLWFPPFKIGFYGTALLKPKPKGR
ncbi:glycosyltransferase family 2 protein [Asticcacaulis sp. EMRT-3]|uniref:glycosyltransferase family 2 protein n=1 Tax=Asticcacaulis sp. EMRT-3 TaxID=3040349 RepID=UPI0024AFF049|nr:glycosyltransferase family 2 protein [Asticcacaulis sp. EMRT-3]MDI7775448.1 glycosyltransferase family 2 protein [Asticcacaulis sp. EMRT-3]